MPLINRETGELPESRTLPDPETQEPPAAPPTAREQLLDLTERSRADYEIKLLEQNLMEYAALFEKLKNEQSDLLRQNSEQIARVIEQVTALISANELLNQNLSGHIEAMILSVKSATMQSVLEIVAANREVLIDMAVRVKTYEGKLVKRLDKHVADFDAKQKRLFSFDGLRTAVFWIACMSCVGEFLITVVKIILGGL